MAQVTTLPSASEQAYQPMPLSDVGQALRRARRTDPESSHAAALKAARFADSHAGRILAALEVICTGTAEEIARQAGLTVVQVDRRAVELQRAGRIAYLTYDSGKHLLRDGYRVWRLA